MTCFSWTRFHGVGTITKKKNAENVVVSKNYSIFLAQFCVEQKNRRDVYNVSLNPTPLNNLNNGKIICLLKKVSNLPFVTLDLLPKQDLELLPGKKILS